MEFEEDGEERPVAPLLPQDDRLWRHPSEVAGAAPDSHAWRWGSGGPHMMTVVALTACISVLLSLGVLAVVGPLRTRIAVERVAAPVMADADLAPLNDVAALTDRMRPAITQVIATGASGERWGSGVIFRSDGMMLTAHRVVAGADSLRVVLHDGREVEGKLLGSDPDTEIALVDLQGGDYRPALLGSTVGLKVGQPAITIGSPTGAATGPLVRVGVVSAVGQQVGADGRNLVDMIQTDGGVDPGCAGGALVDARGAVIGIAATNATTEAGVIGFATPIDVARAVAAQLMNEGRVSRGWLGIEGDSLAGEAASAAHVRGGAVVKNVKSGSPAESAGLVPSDIITAVEGQPVISMPQLMVRLRSYRPGDTVSLSVLRDGLARTLKVRLGQRPA
ncbi:MAG: S1C family serine protease [Actinobacteria bacterium]|nr:S1C family serine protease [Actinomycetota bacterium]MBW3650231.1 S1C family serine protease [Actinomycetota bacterium]